MDPNLVHGTLILALKPLEPGGMIIAISMESGLLMMIYHSNLLLVILQASGTMKKSAKTLKVI